MEGAMKTHPIETNTIDVITGKIIQCAIEVHRELGPGLLESVYEKCLAYELVKAGLSVVTQKELPVRYKDVQIDCGFRMDILVEGTVILEIKAADALTAVHEAQILTYMKLTGIKTGLLMNFNVKLLKDGLRRFVL
jgi:GxxExxY protein